MQGFPVEDRMEAMGMRPFSVLNDEIDCWVEDDRAH